MFFNLACLFLLLAYAQCDKESTLHGHVTGKKPHDQHEDHKIVLGSEKLADEFDDLTPEESKKRLRVLAKKMDANSDGFVTKEELINWIENSSKSLDKEENDERFNEMDANRDGLITWDEYVQEAFYGASEEGKIDVAKMDIEDRKLFEEDKVYFTTADEDNDGMLSREEFSAFQNPELYPVMHTVLTEMTLKEKDVNHDGKIDMKEFMGPDVFENPRSEYYVVEQDRFNNDHDKNGDGFLDGDELKTWLIPNIRTNAEREAEHLMEKSDADKDGKLSIDEVAEAYYIFVGSEATNYGEHMTNLHQEL